MNISKIKFLIGIVVVTLFFSSCQNDPIAFDNFDYTTTCFGWQYPVRTLVLGETSYYDNSNDIKHEFEIKASMGGVYANTKNINVGYEIDSSLADSLSILSGTQTVRLKMLPSNYYELVTSTMVIPKGSFNGGITIKLTDAFFNDPLSCNTNYVLPLRILSSTTDSILKGKAATSAPKSGIAYVSGKWGIDPRIVTNWVVQPKNFTIYGVKYVNKYHGVYLKRGKQQDISTGSTTLPVGYGWEKKYIEYTSYIPKLSTLSLSKLQYNDLIPSTNVNYKAILDVNSDVVTISKDPTSTINVTGTGKYVSGIEEWGGKKRNAFYLDYTVTDPATSKVYAVKDTLVIRDNAVMVEVFAPIIQQ